MNLQAELKKLEKRVSNVKSDIWYEYDMSDLTLDEIKKIRFEHDTAPEEEIRELLSKVRVKRAYPKYPVENSRAYLSIDRVKELQKVYPNVTL